MTGLLAIVLAGGQSQRLGRDKLAEIVAGVPLLDRVLDAIPEGEIVCVGEPRPTSRQVFWTREQPPGAGPCAGVMAGLRAVDQREARIALVMAGDHPFLGLLPARLAAAAREEHIDAAVACDSEGYRHPLLAAYRIDALHRARDRIGDARGLPAKALLDGLRLALIAADARESMDCDDEQALSKAREVADGAS